MFFRGVETTNQITYKPDTQWNDPVITVTAAFHEWRKTSYQLTGDCLVIFHIYLCCSTFATAKKYRILCPRPSSFPVFDAKFGSHFWRNPLMTPLSLSHFAGQQLKFFFANSRHSVTSLASPNTRHMRMDYPANHRKIPEIFHKAKMIF